MKKGFKILVYLMLVICIFVCIFTYYFLYVNKELSGEKLTDGIYLYTLDIGDNNSSVKVLNDNIYYLIETDGKYEFYKTNIYNNSTELLGKLDLENYYCYFESNYIDCSDNENRIMFNYKFKKIYNGEYKTLIPYKKGLIKIENNVIYYKDKEYKKIYKDLSNYNMYNYNIFDDIVYIFFANIDDGTDCILNVKENKCENFKYSGINNYSDGFYFSDEEKIRVLNVYNKSIKEYKNFIKDGYLNTTQLYDNLLYYFDDDYLKIYNLDNEKVNFLDYRINEYIDKIVLDNNLLYLVSSKKVYVLKLDEILTEEMTIDELNTKLEKKITDRIDKIMSEYNVDFKIKKEADLKLDVWKQSTKGEDNNNNINDSLDLSEEVFSIFGKEFFKEFIHDKYTGIRVYLVNKIDSDFSISGEEFRYYDKYAIIASSDDFRRTLCHELMHTIEDAVFTKGKNMFKNWNNYNPKGFKYTVSYDPNDIPYKYTVNYKEGEVYFIDNYAQVDELEDRARIFENICMNTADIIKDNPNILKKAKYEEEEILKYYPMLKSSTIFESIR